MRKFPSIRPRLIGELDAGQLSIILDDWLFKSPAQL